MTMFRLGCIVGVSAYTEVVADSLDAAIEIARTRRVELDTNHGSGSDRAWLIGDGDGVPSDIQEVDK